MFCTSLCQCVWYIKYCADLELYSRAQLHLHNIIYCCLEIHIIIVYMQVVVSSIPFSFSLFTCVILDFIFRCENSFENFVTWWNLSFKSDYRVLKWSPLQRLFLFLQFICALFARGFIVIHTNVYDKKIMFSLLMSMMMSSQGTMKNILFGLPILIHRSSHLISLIYTCIDFKFNTPTRGYSSWFFIVSPHKWWICEHTIK